MRCSWRSNRHSVAPSLLHYLEIRTQMSYSSVPKLGFGVSLSRTLHSNYYSVRLMQPQLKCTNSQNLASCMTSISLLLTAGRMTRRKSTKPSETWEKSSASRKGAGLLYGWINSASIRMGLKWIYNVCRSLSWDVTNCSSYWGKPTASNYW